MFLIILSGCGGDRETVKPPLPVRPISTPPPVTDRPKIIAFGDSLIGGFGIEGWEDSFSAKLQQDLDAEGYDYQVLNYGNSGDIVEWGLARLPLALKVSNNRIFIVELGANNIAKKDDPQQVGSYLRQIVGELRSRRIDVLLCGYRSHPSYGPEYARSVDEMYSGIAAEYGLAFMPDFMAGVSGDPELMQPDGVHPNPKGVLQIEKNVFSILKLTMLSRRDRTKP